MNNKIKLIPIDRIRILNPRHRDRKKFEPILESIKNLGLKKPIQVALRSNGSNGDTGYDLVCGQGRIEAFVALGYKEIPATVVEISAGNACCAVWWRTLPAGIHPRWN